jgi:hypothetical protein
LANDTQLPNDPKSFSWNASMKVTKWWKKIAVSLVTAGMLSPLAALAVDIPLLDPSFEAYAVPGSGFAYANTYRPTSAWIDDQDMPGMDNGASNWLYNAAYSGVAPKRGAPRTGNQAMHGLFHYSTQEAADTFEAGKTYTFSVYAQGDDDTAGDDSRVWLYLFDGANPFSEPTSLNFAKYSPLTGDFINRPATANQDQSKALWQKVSISHTVHTGDPAVGHPIGVGFWAGRDAGVDDASLTETVTVLTLEVRTTDGSVRILNETGKPIAMDYYELTSSLGSLNKPGWLSLEDQNLVGFPAGSGSGDGWEEGGFTTDKVLNESFLQANILGNSFVDGTPIGLGTAYQIGDPQDIQFWYAKVPDNSLRADFDQDGDVDGSDFLTWQRGSGLVGAPATLTNGNANSDQTINAQDLAIWEEEYGNTTGAAGIGQLIRGHVRYVPSFITPVPEPCTLALVGIGLLAFTSRLMSGSRKGTPS